MRQVPLTVLTGGINRLQVKGGASPSKLYDLKNAWINSEGSVQPREGTTRTATLTSGTVGLAAANGTFNIFSSAYSTASLPSGYVLNVLSNPNDTTTHPQKIYYAKPFMGFLYVVASFSDASVHHYWLQNDGTWTSSTDYTSASIVLAPTTNGLAYQGVRDFPPQPLWAPNTQITSGSYVEPNEATGFAYQAILVTGSPVHTSEVEPVWPVVEGGIVQEFGDFDVSATDAGTTQGNSGTITTAAALGGTITDRYGNSGTIANSGIFSTASTLSTLTLASTKITTWKAGSNYPPGSVVVPTSNQGAFINAIPNGDFEGGAGAGGWSFTDPNGTLQWFYSAARPYQGTECIEFPSGGGIGSTGAYATMTSYSLVNPGQSVTASAYLDPNNSGAILTMWIQLNWYNSSDTLISTTGSRQNEQEGGGYRKTSITGTAPTGAARVRVAIGAGSGTSSRNSGYADLVTWNLETAAPITNFLFEAVQPASASAGATEPTWPTVLGNSVLDGGVTWKAIGTSIITWQAIPLMKSGTVAPTFPTVIGNAVNDSSSYTNKNGYITTYCSMSWECIDRHVADSKCPNSIATVIGASHVFSGDNDICDFSAAVNPIDWSSTNNAGYLPTGLNSYGDNPIAALALYRGNLVVFNAGGYQMWQIDADPQNMAFLDAQPVGSIYPRAAQAVGNDLLFLSEVGVRNLGTVGATANLAIGNTGQPVDPLVVEQLTGTFDTSSTNFVVTCGAVTPNDPLGGGYVSAGLHGSSFNNQVTAGSITPANFGTIPVAGCRGDNTATTSTDLYLYFQGNIPASALLSMSGTDISGNPYTVLGANADISVSFTGGTWTEFYWQNVTTDYPFPPTGTADIVLTAPGSGSPTYDPLSAYYPGRGQYWLIFGPQVFVLTINGNSKKTWSRYVFPASITDITLNAGILYMRTSTNVVWKLDAAAIGVDDSDTITTAATPVPFSGVMQWPYLDMSSLGTNKMLVGVDLVGKGVVNLQIGFDQADDTTFNDDAGFATSLNVTTPYTISIADTVPGEPLPFPINAPSYTLILTFPGSQAWSWNAANLYVADQRGGGATG